MICEFTIFVGTYKFDKVAMKFSNGAGCDTVNLNICSVYVNKYCGSSICSCLVAILK